MWESTKQRDRATEKELERLRLEVEKLRLETASKLDTAEKVKHEWNGLLLQGLVTGGLGIGKSSPYFISLVVTM